MKNGFKQALLSVLAGLLWTGVSLAGGHTGGSAMQSGEGMGIPPKLAEELDLSQQQQQDLLALTQLYAPRIKEVAERGKADRERLALMAPDDSGYSVLSAEVSQEAGLAAAEVVTLMTELQANLYALLSEDQQAKYLALREEQRAKMEAKREAWENGERPEHKHGEQCPHHAEHHGEESSPAS
ncbi:MAG: Spy/CpxP family protein refolding chaperone [Gammaproteobacteria bacterium]